MTILQEKNGLSWFTFEIFTPYQDRLRHACFTRNGGLSSPPYDSLNVGLSVGDIPEHVQENRRRIAAHFDSSAEKLFDLEQVHGLDFFLAETSNPKIKGDILLTKTPKNILMIKHADCQVAILYDPIHHAVAAVHAGWRGQIQKAYTHALSLMATTWNTNPRDVIAGVSPSLGLHHSEFLSWKTEFPPELWPFANQNTNLSFGLSCPENKRDREIDFAKKSEGNSRRAILEDLFAKDTPEITYFQSDKPKTQVSMDLKAIARYELVQAGVQEKNIEISNLCTFENEDLFFSYRREHTTGRLATCVQLLK